MKRALVLQGVQSCILNRNYCQKIRDYLVMNDFKLCMTIEEADLVFYAGCGNL